MAEVKCKFNRKNKKIEPAGPITRPRPTRTFERDIFAGFHENILRLSLNFIMGCKYVFTKLHPDWLVNPLNTLANLEIDIGNLLLKILIEYQGFQHEEYIESYHGSPEGFRRQLFIDDYKKKVCKEKGFLLICISAKECPTLESQLQYIYDTVMREGTPFQKHIFAQCWLRTMLMFSTEFNVIPGGSRTRYHLEFQSNQRPATAITEIGAVYVEGRAKRSSYKVIAGIETMIRSVETNARYFFYISPHNTENYERHRAADPKRCILINEKSIRLPAETVKLIGKMATSSRRSAGNDTSMEG